MYVHWLFIGELPDVPALYYSPHVYLKGNRVSYVLVEWNMDTPFPTPATSPICLRIIRVCMSGYGNEPRLRKRSFFSQEIRAVRGEHYSFIVQLVRFHHVHNMI
jgi:hypothetical protein